MTNLKKVLNHPLVDINLGVLTGLYGNKQIDYAIGCIESTVRKAVPEMENVSSLMDLYESLRMDPNYNLFFYNKSNKVENKNPSYKSCNGF